MSTILGGACDISLPAIVAHIFFTHWIGPAVTSVPHGFQGDEYWLAFPFFFLDYALRQSYGVEGSLRTSPQEMGLGGHGVFFPFPCVFMVHFPSLDFEIEEMLRGVWVNENENF